MKECDNSKMHISSNFILSVCLLIMFDTLLLRPSLHCNISLLFTTLHYTSRHFTSSHLHFSTLSLGLTHWHFLSFYFTLHHETRRSTVLISKFISKIMNPFNAVKNVSTFHFTSLFIFSLILSTIHFTLLWYSYLQLTLLHFLSRFTFYQFQFPLLFSLS